MCHWLRQCPIIVALLAASACSAFAAELHPINGEPHEAAITSIDADRTLHLASKGKRETASLGAIVRWGRFADAPRGQQIVLTTGGLIVADEVSLQGEKLTAFTRTFGDIQLPVELVAGILLRPPSNAAKRDAMLARSTDSPTELDKAESDKIVLTNGDELSGTIEALTAASLSLQIEVGAEKHTVEIEIGRIALVIFNPALRSKAAGKREHILLGFHDGSRVSAISVQGEAKLSINLMRDVTITAPIAELSAVQPLGAAKTGAGVTYLSDLKPLSYRHVPYLSLTWPYQLDRSVAGGQLRASGEIFPKGIGLHSAARLTFDLPAASQKFAADLAIDERVGSAGSVTVRLLIDDGSGKWQPAYTSPMIRGGEKPTPVAVELAGAKRLTILVDYGDHGDSQDHIDLLNARVTTSSVDP
jgi:hypothetical protein